MNSPERCPECGSDEIAESSRTVLGTQVPVSVCGACHWVSDPRVGRPPADRSKNVTLRRLLHAAPTPGSEEAARQGPAERVELDVDSHREDRSPEFEPLDD